MPVKRARTSDAQSDVEIVAKLRRLNTAFRTGLAINSGPAFLDIPVFADKKLWLPVQHRLSSLHRRDPGELQNVLVEFELQAQHLKRKVSWVAKENQDPRLLGEPLSLQALICRLIDRARGAMPPQKLSKTDGTSRADRHSTWNDLFEDGGRAMPYPSFTTHHQAMIKDGTEAPVRPARDHRIHRPSWDQKQKKRSMAELSPNETRPAKNARPSPPSDAENEVEEELTAASQSRRRGDVPKSANTSFATTNAGISFPRSSASTLRRSFIDTPGTSFGLEDDQPTDIHQKRVSGVAHQRVNGVAHLVAKDESSVQRPNTASQRADLNAKGPEIYKEVPCNGNSLMPGFSQISSTEESQLIRLEEAAQRRVSGRTTRIASSVHKDRTGRSSSRNRTESDAFSVGSAFAGSIPDEPRLISTNSTTATRTTDECVATQEECVASDLSFFVDQQSPFSKASMTAYNLPLRLHYEIVRVALSKQLSPDRVAKDLQVHLQKAHPGRSLEESDYRTIWRSLSKVCAIDTSRLERSSDKAWTAAGEDPSTAVLSGRLALVEEHSGKMSATFSLSPLRLESTSTRVSRRYGADRLLMLDVSEIPGTAREAFEDWLYSREHALLGRQWQAFCVKPNKEKKEKIVDRPYRVYLFATRGRGLQRITIYQMLDSFIALRKENNIKQHAAKLFSRISLLLTDTIPTHVFQPKQLVLMPDAWSCCPSRRKLSKKKRDGEDAAHQHTGEIMNDGAARISFSAAQKISRSIGLDYIPAVFQGRIAGAKGLWTTEFDTANDAEYGGEDWIEITKSQQKFECYKSGRRHHESNYTFEVHYCPRALTPHHLNDTLIPILTDRGVPTESLRQLIDEDLDRKISQIMKAMQHGGPLFYQWVHENMPIAAERASAGQVKMSGAFPSTPGEIIVSLLSAGCHPLRDHALFMSCKGVIEKHSQMLEERISIDLPRSTFALMVPDHLNVLEEGEVHLAFSQSFVDPDSGILYPHLDGVDVLVARFPSHLPWDVQKVRAVYKPELAAYKDVIFFSVRCQPGRTGLADHLSGGDFDGDKAFVCWESKLVSPFENAERLKTKTATELGIKTDRSVASELLSKRDITKFILKGVEFNMRRSMLGICSNWYLSYNYHQKSIREQLDIGAMLGYLVDAPKQGFLFGKQDFDELLKSLGLSRRPLDKPFFKLDREERSNSRPTDHVIDTLLEHTRLHLRKNLDEKFNELGNAVPQYDQTYARMFLQEKERAKKRGDKEVRSVLEDLEEEDLETFRGWFEQEKTKILRRDDRRKKEKRPLPDDERQETYAQFLGRARQRFLQIEPRSRGTDTLDRWAADCKSQKDESNLSSSGAWTMLKASALYAVHHRGKSTFPWLICGKELCEMKAATVDRLSFTVVGDMYCAQRPDKKLIEKYQNAADLPERTEEEYYPGMEKDERSTIADAMSLMGTIDDLRDF